MTATGAAPRPADRASLRGLTPTQRDAKGRVRHEALTDGATLLPNRLHFDVVYRLVWEAGGRGVPVTLLRFDLVGLATASADEQRRIGDRLNLITRQMDMIARLDAERFGVLLMVCNAFGGKIAAERYQSVLASEIESVGLSFAAGIAGWKEWMTKPDDLMTAAEEALETARGSRERIEVHVR